MPFDLPFPLVFVAVLVMIGVASSLVRRGTEKQARQAEADLAPAAAERGWTLDVERNGRSSVYRYAGSTAGVAWRLIAAHLEGSRTMGSATHRRDYTRWSTEAGATPGEGLLVLMPLPPEAIAGMPKNAGAVGDSLLGSFVFKMYLKMAFGAETEAPEVGRCHHWPAAGPFGERYYVLTSDDGLAAERLTEEVQGLLLGWVPRMADRLGGLPSVVWGPDGLALSFREYLPRPEDADRVVALGAAVASRTGAERAMA